MIRFLLHKSVLPSALEILRNVPKVHQLPKTLKSPCFSTGANIASSSSNSSLAKDVVVYKYENPRYFHLMNAFTISQFIFWGYLGHWSYTSLRDVKVPQEEKENDELSWWRKVNLGEDKYKNSLGIFCLVVAYVVLFVGWTFTLRSVRYLIALKNGKDVSIVTYTPFGRNRILNVPINCISAQDSRATAKTYLPLKIKNKKLYYILDMKGEFKNTKMFDQSIGLSRKF